MSGDGFLDSPPVSSLSSTPGSLTPYTVSSLGLPPVGINADVDEAPRVRADNYRNSLLMIDNYFDDPSRTAPEDEDDDNHQETIGDYLGVTGRFGTLLDQDEVGYSASQQDLTGSRLVAPATPTSEVVHAKYKPRGKSKLFWAIFNLWNDVLAPGTVAIPYYVLQAGVYMGPLLFVVTGVISSYTLYLVYYLARKHRVRNFGQLCRLGLGTPGYVMSIFFMFVFNYGSFLANVMIMGTNMPNVLRALTRQDWFIFDRHYVLLFSCLIFLPLAFMKNIANYSFLSFLSMSCIFLLIAMVIVRAFFRGPHDFAPPTVGAYDFYQPGVFQAAGGISFLFVCHDLSISVYESFKNPTPARWGVVILVTMGLTSLACITLGLAGYTLFTGNTNANVLQNFPQDDVSANVARIALAINILLSVPYMSFMPRLALMLAIKLVWRRMPRRVEKVMHSVMTLVVILSVLGISEVLDNLGLVVTLCGGISAVGLAFILPPLLYLRMEPQPFYHPKKLVAIAVLVFGINSMIMTVATSIAGQFWPLPTAAPTQHL